MSTHNSHPHKNHHSSNCGGCDSCSHRKHFEKRDCDKNNKHDYSYKKHKIVWPPQSPDDGYQHLAVGDGTFDSVDDIIRAIKMSHEGTSKHSDYGMKCPDLGDKKSNVGYVIHLPPGVHYIYESMSNDVKYLRFEGDHNSVKGVGYFHKLGNWGSYPTFSEEYDFCTGGLGPFNVSVDCDKITVNSCRTPDFSSLQCGDKLVFYDKNGKFTTYKVEEGSDNDIYVDCPIKKGDGCLTKGEGFFIKPNVTLKFCSKNNSSQKMLVEHRLEYVGLTMDLGGMLVTGATGGHTGIEHSVVKGDCSNLVHVGRSDWYKPNVFLNTLTYLNGSNGTGMLQTFVGVDSQVHFNSNPQTQFWFGVYINNKNAINIVNGGAISAFSSDFCGCGTGATILHSSKFNLNKCRFFGCDTGILGKYNSSCSSHPTLGTVNSMIPLFENCNVGLDVDFTHHTTFDVVTFTGVTTQLILDGIVHPVLPATGTIGLRNSVIAHNNP